MTTVPGGDPAFVNVSVAGSVLHFAFGPQRGDTGPEGPMGPPFAQALVDAVNTVPAGSSAQVTVTFDGSNVRFTFDIRQGAEGAQGPPGEVSQAVLDGAIATTLVNPGGVTPLNLMVSAPPSQGEMQSLSDKLDELVNALTQV